MRAAPPEDERIYQLMKPDQRFTVGDVDQCVFEFRGADPSILYNLARSPDARMLKLERNHRSGKNIVEAANRLIARNPDRIDKVMRAVRDDTDGAVGDIS